MKKKCKTLFPEKCEKKTVHIITQKSVCFKYREVRHA